MNNDLTVTIRRDVVEKAIEFLQQIYVNLQYSIYPDDGYKRDTIEDVIAEIERACMRDM